MRVKRMDKYRRNRYRKGRILIFVALILPCMLIFLGYLISSCIILPAMAGK